MILKVKATNKHNGEIIEYELEGETGLDMAYFDANLNEKVHMQEVADNKIREVNNNLILQDSPMYTIKPGETESIEAMSYLIEIKAE